MKILQYLLSIVLAVIILTSCSPQKRLHRLVALHPELVKNDTIYFRDTTIIPATRIDTSFHESKLTDTIILTKEKLRVKIHRVHDTVYVEAEHEADTIIIEKDVAVERIVRQSNKQSIIDKLCAECKYYLIIIVIWGVLILGVVIGLSVKRRRNLSP